jgi:hypothetical protein
MQIVIEHITDEAGLLDSRRVFNVPKWRDADTMIVDARGWHAYPALYDADTLLALHEARLAEEDRDIALAGGVANMNVSVAWQRLADAAEAPLLHGLAAGSDMPRVRLLAAAMPDYDNAGFVDWFLPFSKRPAVQRAGVLSACKLYGRDPTFARNLDAVWEADWLPMVFTDAPERVAERAVALGKPVVIRHATTPNTIARVREIGHAPDGDDDVLILACAPHYLTPVSATRRAACHVRPPLLDDDARLALQGCIDDIDLLATDHVAQGATRGPGLQSQHGFMSALLDTAARIGCSPHGLIGKASRRPSALFGPDVNDWAVALVAPTPRAGMTSDRERFPGIQESRDPYAENRFSHRVVAIVRGETLWPTRHLRQTI